MIWTMKQGRGKWQRFRTGTMVAVHPLGAPKGGRRFAAKGLKQASTSVESKIKRGATRRDGTGVVPYKRISGAFASAPPYHTNDYYCGAAAWRFYNEKNTLQPDA